MIGRRRFVQATASASASLMMSPLRTAAGSMAGPSVYEIHDPSMVQGTKAVKEKVNEAAVASALNAVVIRMTGLDEIGPAWEAFFPGITKKSRIAIKLNIYSKGPQFALLKALVNGLKSMFGGAYSGANIWVFENDMDWTVEKYYKDDGIKDLGVTTRVGTYIGPSIKIKGQDRLVAEAFQTADFGISLVGSRVHSWKPSGAGMFTGQIKNMMGAVSDRKDRFSGAGHFHGNQQGYVDLFKTYMREHLHLYIADHILIPRSEHKRYPGFEKIENRIVVGMDPCAVDSRSIDIVKKHYKEATKTLPTALEKAGLGSVQYNLVNVKSSATAAGRTRAGDEGPLTIALAGRTGSPLLVPLPGTAPVSAVRIHDLHGSLVRSFSGIGRKRTLTWDGRNLKGIPVSPGRYVARVSAGSATYSGLFQIGR